MRRLVRGLRPSPALVIACLSLFVAMGGVGYAALKGKDKKRVRCDRGPGDQQAGTRPERGERRNADKLGGTSGGRLPEVL